MYIYLHIYIYNYNIHAQTGSVQSDIWRCSYQDQQEGAGSVGHCAAHLYGAKLLVQGNYFVV